MKIMKYASFAALGVVMLLIGCNDDSMAPSFENTKSLTHQMSAIDDIGSGQQNTLPVVTVIKNNFSGATGWRVTWKGGIITSENADRVQSVFSTITGAVNSTEYLNAVSPGNTDNADMQLYFGKLKATSEVSDLTNVTELKETRFRLSTWNVATLEDAAVTNPQNFGIAYELGAFGSKVLETGNYSAGQIYLFKTDRVPVKYGAVRIVKTGGAEKIIEVVVQK